MKALNELINNAAIKSAVTSTSTVEGKEVTTTSEVVTHSPVSVTRNNITRKLDVLEIQRKDDKGHKYYGLKVWNASEPEDSQLLPIIDWLGEDIVGPLVETALNTKMQTFNETAYSNAAKLSKEVTFEAFTKELTSMVASWSMRAITKKQLGEEMAALGKELATASVERKMVIMTRLAEIASVWNTTTEA